MMNRKRGAIYSGHEDIFRDTHVEM